MNVFSAGRGNRVWVWQVTLLCFALGFLLAGSLQTVQRINRSGTGMLRIGQSGLSVPSITETYRKQEQEIADSRRRNTELENSLGSGKGQLATLNSELQKVKILAGLTDVYGPGLVLTLQDSRKQNTAMPALNTMDGLIHDVDIENAISELGQSGAEAVSINGQRIVGRTAIRCVGPTILVNNVPLAPPYSIVAIGDKSTLAGGLSLPGGVLDGLKRTDPQMFRLERRDKVVVPAYTGSTEVMFAKQVEGPISGGKRSKKK